MKFTVMQISVIHEVHIIFSSVIWRKKNFFLSEFWSGAAKADRNFPNFSEFCRFFTLEQKWLFKLSFDEEY